jgi:hypothetical protein
MGKPAKSRNTPRFLGYHTLELMKSAGLPKSDDTPRIFTAFSLESPKTAGQQNPSIYHGFWMLSASE